MPLRTFQINPDTQMLTERRHYAPTDHTRAKMLAILPVDASGIARWVSADDLRYLELGTPERIDSPDGRERRLFTTPSERGQMEKIVLPSLPGGFRIEARWETPKDADGNPDPGAVWTLVLGAVRDASAPATVASGDGLDAKTLPELLTIAGVEQVKDAAGKPLKAKTMEPPELIAHIRAHRAKKTAPTQEPALAV